MENAPSNQRLAGRVALVTGGTRGIGAATALAFARAGSDVAILGRHLDDEARRTLDSLEKTGRRSLALAADCSRPEDLTRATDEIASRLGPIDLLVHSAGGPVPGNILEVTPEAWRAAFDVHIHPIYHLCRALLPSMRQRKWGSIVLIGSSAGARGCPGNTAYQVVKGSLPQFARALARDFAADNIRINVVSPGVIRTRFHDAMTPEMQRNNLENRIPLRREGTSDQVASLILEIATNEYVTGENYMIDGGLTMRIV